MRRAYWLLGFSRTHCSLSPVQTKAQSRMAARLARGPLPPVNTVLDGPNDIEAALPRDIEEAHRCAVAAGKETYSDPVTGLTVFTRVAHINKGRCCGCKCRHCPYGHVNVPASLKTPQQQDNVIKDTEGETPPAPTKSGVYTRTGDKGTSSLFTGERRSKNDLVFHALGTVDELNSHIGLARAYLHDAAVFPLKPRLMSALEDVQRRLFHCGALVATPSSADRPILHNPQDWTKELEALVDAMDATLPPLASFILPGGGKAAAQLHVCRSTCRRAERCIVELLDRDHTRYQTSAVADAAIFVNRLSDFFFVAARLASDVSQEIPWMKEQS